MSNLKFKIKMKKIFSLALVCLTAIVFTACNKNEPTAPAVDFDKMVGTWNLNNYSVVITNMDEGKEVSNTSRNSGLLTITKKTEDGDVYYDYTENFIDESGEEYSGRFIISKNTIEMGDSDGFLRKGVDTYDFTVSTLTDNKMEWTYDVEQQYSNSASGENYKRKVVAKAVFTKK